MAVQSGARKQAELLFIVSRCRLRPLFGTPSDGDSGRETAAALNPTAEAAIEKALKECYEHALRAHPRDAREVVAIASGDMKAPRFEIVAAADRKPWRWSAQLSACATGLLENAPFAAGRLEGELGLAPPSKR